MATTKSKPDPPAPKVTLTPRADGVLVATWKRRTIRFLLSGGATVDVDTERDDSELRGAILAHTGAERIEGSTTLVQNDESPGT